MRELQAGPVFTPMTVPPKLLNRDEVNAAVSRAYPAELRDAGIGGTSIVWMLLDSTGVVQKAQVHKSSGYPLLDRAAMKVIPAMKWAPAELSKEKTTVWLQVPIVFKVN